MLPNLKVTRKSWKTLLPYLAYGLFFAFMFSFFLGARHIERSGAAYLVARLHKTGCIWSDGAKLQTFPPSISFSSLALTAGPNRAANLRLENATLSIGLGGLFPPKARISIAAEFAGGSLRLELTPDSVQTPASGTASFSLQGAELAKLLPDLPLLTIENGLVAVRGECVFQEDWKKTEGKADITVGGAELGLPFSDPNLRRLRGIHAQAGLEFGQGQLSVRSLSAGNEQLSLQGGGVLELRQPVPEENTLDFRLALSKTQDSPPFLENFSSVAKLNAGQVVNVQIGGSISNPVAQVK